MADFDDKLKHIRQVTSNKTKHVEAEKKIVYLTNKVAQILEKGHGVLVGRTYFSDNSGCQNFLVFASMLSFLILDNNKKVTK